MSDQHKTDILHLEKKVESLSNDLRHLAVEDTFIELIKIFRRPGWTTPAEFIFASGIVDSMLEHTKALTNMKENLLKGSEAVTMKEAGIGA